MSVQYDEAFEKCIRKLRHETLKSKVKTQIQKILANPTIGKPMRHERKGTREVYIPPFRLSYAYDEKAGMVIFLAIYAKDEQ